MDLDEYITLTNAPDTEPMLGINLSSGIEWNRQAEAVQEAIDMIKYCQSKNFDAKYFYLDNQTYHKGNGYNKDRDVDDESYSPMSRSQNLNDKSSDWKAQFADFNGDGSVDML